MKPTRIGLAATCAFVLALLACATPVTAQSGQLKGKVVDAQNKPVADAKIVMEATETSRKVETKSNGKGEFIQIGLPPGNYKVTATKGDLAQSFSVRVGLDMKELNFVLKPGGAGGEMSADEAKKAAARIELVKTTFAEGATLTNEGKYDEALAKFNAVVAEVPKCFDCYNNIGTIYIRKLDWVKAEESFKKALELNVESVEAYNGMATVYNAQKKFKEAQQMSAEATKRMVGAGATAGGGNADSLYNAAVISWNSNDFAKANELLSEAVKITPTHSEAHFMLGRVLINLGKLGEAATEFETYLKLAPTGPNAKEAQTNFDALKSYRK
ncbi:MAG: tetratricopeptide repeat protein [Vicinamibacterales bacterium]